MSDAEYYRGLVERKYRELGYKHGWAFMGTPEARLYDAAVAIVGLNPGGGGASDEYVYGGLWQQLEGNGYFREKWRTGDQYSPLQIQLHEWHRLLGIRESESFCANFVPYRSHDWASLNHQAAAIEVASQLWNWVQRVSPARLFITMGKVAAEHLSMLLNATYVESLPAGWGRQVIDVYWAPSGRRLVAMPHPSRYTLFGRGAASELAEASFWRATLGRRGTT